jgi:predicted site-specific integrase-resolvase
MSRKVYSTEQAAKAVGITRATLQAWIKDGKVAPPAPTLEGAVAKRLWLVKDVEGLRQAKKEHYRKGRGRKPKRQR